MIEEMIEDMYVEALKKNNALLEQNLKLKVKLEEAEKEIKFLAFTKAWIASSREGTCLKKVDIYKKIIQKIIVGKLTIKQAKKYI